MATHATEDASVVPPHRARHNATLAAHTTHNATTQCHDRERGKYLTPAASRIFLICLTDNLLVSPRTELIPSSAPPLERGGFRVTTGEEKDAWEEVSAAERVTLGINRTNTPSWVWAKGQSGGKAL